MNGTKSVTLRPAFFKYAIVWLIVCIVFVLFGWWWLDLPSQFILWQVVCGALSLVTALAFAGFSVALTTTEISAEGLTNCAFGAFGLRLKWEEVRQVDRLCGLLVYYVVTGSWAISQIVIVPPLFMLKDAKGTQSQLRELLGSLSAPLPEAGAKFVALYLKA